MSETWPDTGPRHIERWICGTTVVELSGEIDILTAPSVSAHLDALTACPHPDLVVDLRTVSFIDCSGLSTLCRARKRALEQRGRLRLVADSARFLRILRYAGLSGVFEVHRRLSEALAGTPRQSVVPAAAR
ncbi:STAS domain-containing protein [Streptomyces cavernae]|uniref:STAS domain-containing protein n=1 Tax=Streptomyces cavernae TaxID=2259034 RepID=UPI000FEBADFB|nr:STAS domain-containing protein [Streptomyces cavernae]